MPMKTLDAQYELGDPRPAAGGATPGEVAGMSLTELIDHIETTHHAYLREELPRLAGMTREVAFMHGGRDERLHEVEGTFRTLAAELWCHMLKEEQCLFPMIKQLEANQQAATSRCGTVANPIRQMEFEHDDADAALARLRDLTAGFEPPEWAGKIYRALLARLAHLETDMHCHIHKENGILFPRALELESSRQPELHPS
jgi:regulator of cell morphogenesis and NO signaling